MTLRRILRYQFICDGYKPDGSPCPCDVVVDAPSRFDAETKIQSYGWHEGASRGLWLCNARGGHRDD